MLDTGRKNLGKEMGKVSLLFPLLFLIFTGCRTIGTGTSQVSGTCSSAPCVTKVYYHWGNAAYLDPLVKEGRFSQQSVTTWKENGRLNGVFGSGLYVADGIAKSAEYADDDLPYVMKIIVNEKDVQSIGDPKKGWFRIKNPEKIIQITKPDKEEIINKKVVEIFGNDGMKNMKGKIIYL